MCIAARVSTTTAHRWIGSYLFVNPQGQAFLLDEDKPLAEVWVREHYAWLVGLYDGRQRKAAMSVDVAGLVEDLAEHLKGFPA